MKGITSIRGGTGETITLLAAGTILGIAIGAGGCARAEKKAPLLPPARVDHSAALRGPRQVIVCGELGDVDRRANALMLAGWKAIPGTQALNGADRAMLVLEQKPRPAAP